MEEKDLLINELDLVLLRDEIECQECDGKLELELITLGTEQKITSYCKSCDLTEDDISAECMMILSELNIFTYDENYERIRLKNFMDSH